MAGATTGAFTGNVAEALCPAGSVIRIVQVRAAVPTLIVATIWVAVTLLTVRVRGETRVACRPRWRRHKARAGDGEGLIGRGPRHRVRIQRRDGDRREAAARALQLSAIA